MRGLNNEFKTKVKTQYPKTLKDAIKCAQIYDDIVVKPSHVIERPKFDTSQDYVNKVGNCKMDIHSKEDVSKKPKGTIGPLLK